MRISDWSSYVCSSDLPLRRVRPRRRRQAVAKRCCRRQIIERGNAERLAMRIRRRQDAGLGELRRAERIVELRYRVFLRAVQRRELLRIGVGDFLKHDAELLDVVEPEQRLDRKSVV